MYIYTYVYIYVHVYTHQEAVNARGRIHARDARRPRTGTGDTRGRLACPLTRDRAPGSRAATRASGSRPGPPTKSIYPKIDLLVEFWSKSGVSAKL